MKARNGLFNLGSRLTPISPPPVKGADLLPPVVLGNPSAAAERDPVAFFLLRGLRVQHWCRSLTRHPTPIEALAPRGGVRARRHSRPRNSVVPSYRPPHDGRRHRGATVVSRLGGGATSNGKRESDRGEVRVASHQPRALPDPWFPIAPGAPAHGWSAIFGELGP